jgi:uncharacterized protein YoxC
MAEQGSEPTTRTEDEILEQQYLRALSSFEGIVLSQIDIKNKLGDRLNYSIRTGLIILSVIALSILVLLLTLSAQINRISGVVAAMNTHFSNVSDEMHLISQRMVVMEEYISLMRVMEEDTGKLNAEIAEMQSDMSSVGQSVKGVGGTLSGVRGQVGSIAITIDRMNAEVNTMSAEMSRLSQPARSFNRLMPFP